jgi:hypothetical protein
MAVHFLAEIAPKTAPDRVDVPVSLTFSTHGSRFHPLLAVRRGDQPGRRDAPKPSSFGQYPWHGDVTYVARGDIHVEDAVSFG